MAIFRNLCVRLRFESSKYFNVFLRLIPLKRDAFLDLANNLSFSDKLLGPGREDLISAREGLDKRS